jgi:hypothetical protein
MRHDPALLSLNHRTSSAAAADDVHDVPQED